MKKNIVLVGFMGAGKSLISEKLAERLKCLVVSTDELIVKREGRSITDIFKTSGEPYFRKIEQQIVAEVSIQKNLIIDCGGGVVLDPDNIAALKHGGLLFYLYATPEEIFQRIGPQKHRPLLNTLNPRKNIEELLERREAFYAQADYTIDTNRKTPESICEEIINLAEPKS